MRPEDVAAVEPALPESGRSGARKSARLDLPEDILLAEAFREITGNALGDLLGNVPAAARGDPEGVHQLRVAIRRLRAALVLFRGELDGEAAGRFEAELKRLGRIFGEARDWDVFCLQTLPAAEKALPAAGLGELRPMAEARRQETHRRIGETLEATSFTWLVLGLSAWIEAALAAPFRDLPLADEAARLLGQVEGRVAKRGRHIDRRSLEELHALRKSLKKLRYGIESLAGLYRRKRVRDYLRGVKALQEQLGALNDAVVAERLAETLGEAPAAIALIAWSQTRIDDARAELPRSCKKFRRESAFWD